MNTFIYISSDGRREEFKADELQTRVLLKHLRGECKLVHTEKEVTAPVDKDIGRPDGIGAF